MESGFLESRLQVLRKAQNPDGGWGYYAGKASWLEPTVLAALALHGAPESDAAWALVESWALPGGGWKPAAEVPQANWTTALAVLLARVRGEKAVAGVDWLRAHAARNPSLAQGWSWSPGNAPASEPTAWTILALRKSGVTVSPKFLLDEQLDPETCGPELLALQGSAEALALLPLAAAWAKETHSALTRAWLALGLRLNGADPGEADAPVPRNLAIAALEALAAKDGGHRLLRLEVAA